MPTLILLRHGQSQWNLEDRYTGWVDVDLTAEGEAQATKGGQLIAAAGLAIERCYTSVLTRAIRTSWLALAAVLFAKAMLEERGLRAQFAGYAAYAEKVRRVLPGLF